MKKIVETLLEVAESHLLWRNALLLLNTLLDSIDLVCRLDVDLDLLAGEGLRLKSASFQPKLVLLTEQKWNKKKFNTISCNLP